MDITVANVRVTNWSSQPFLSLSRDQRDKLALAIRFSREMVDDACAMLGEYQRYKQFSQVDRKMAKDLTIVDEGAPDALNKYFGLKIKTMADLAILSGIVTKYRQVQQGIRGKFEIVVGAVHDGDDIRTGMHNAAASLFSNGSKGPREAWEDIKFIRKTTEGWVRGGSVGRIHLNTNSIKDESESRIARIIVHEASHKFAATVDVVYKDAGGLEYNNGGFIGLENNADSFAWGARAMWRAKRKIPKTA